jgi:hypothetical protein
VFSALHAGIVLLLGVGVAHADTPEMKELKPGEFIQ